MPFITELFISPLFLPSQDSSYINSKCLLIMRNMQKDSGGCRTKYLNSSALCNIIHDYLYPTLHQISHFLLIWDCSTINSQLIIMPSCHLIILKIPACNQKPGMPAAVIFLAHQQILGKCHFKLLYALLTPDSLPACLFLPSCWLPLMHKNFCLLLCINSYF